MCAAASNPDDEDANGTPLTVLSCLARLNVDPWDEAARLAQLPREAAAAVLATLVAALPEGSEGPLDAVAVAARLAALLPGNTPAPAAGHQVLPRGSLPRAGLSPRTRRRTTLYAVVLVLLLAGEWLLLR